MIAVFTNDCSVVAIIIIFFYTQPTVNHLLGTTDMK